MEIEDRVRVRERKRETKKMKTKQNKILCDTLKAKKRIPDAIDCRSGIVQQYSHRHGRSLWIFITYFYLTSLSPLEICGEKEEREKDGHRRTQSFKCSTVRDGKSKREGKMVTSKSKTTHTFIYVAMLKCDTVNSGSGSGSKSKKQPQPHYLAIRVNVASVWVNCILRYKQ